MFFLAVTYHLHFWQNDGDLFSFFRFETIPGRNQIQQYKFLGRERVKNDREECDGDGGAAPPPPPSLYDDDVDYYYSVSEAETKTPILRLSRMDQFMICCIFCGIYKRILSITFFVCGLFVGVFFFFFFFFYSVCVMVKMSTLQSGTSTVHRQNSGPMTKMYAAQLLTMLTCVSSRTDVSRATRPSNVLLGTAVSAFPRKRTADKRYCTALFGTGRSCYTTISPFQSTVHKERVTRSRA